jgi:2-dehydro-3-deoxyphosphogluconate aldolase/(4S)-4-hydroxy-2-oxoglutarate aldolase
LTITTEQLRQVGVIAVVRAPSAESAIAGVEALVRGGVTGIEITFSTPETSRVISHLADRFGDSILLGAGTVVRPEQAAEAAAAGARFLVSPGISRTVAQAMFDTGLTTMLGALTPTEVMAAVELGADVVKIFPAGFAGPRLISSFRGPFPDVVMMPTGGVSTANLADWLATGVVAVGAGSELISGADLAAGRFDLIQQRAEEISTRYRQLRLAEVAA